MLYLRLKLGTAMMLSISLAFEMRSRTATGNLRKSKWRELRIFYHMLLES